MFHVSRPFHDGRNTTETAPDGAHRRVMTATGRGSSDGFRAGRGRFRSHRRGFRGFFGASDNRKPPKKSSFFRKRLGFAPLEPACARSKSLKTDRKEPFAVFSVIIIKVLAHERRGSGLKTGRKEPFFPKATRFRAGESRECTRFGGFRDSRDSQKAPGARAIPGGWP